MPGAKKVRFASPPVLSPMSHDELDDYEDYEAAKAAARAAYEEDDDTAETAALTARDEERGSADDDGAAAETAAMTARDDDAAAAETAPKAELGSVAALILIALSAFGFSAQALIVKFLTRSDPVPPMEIVFFRGCFQFLGCCGLLGLYPPMCRAPSRWFGDSWREMKWLGLRGLVGFGGIAFSFQAVSLLGIAEVQVVQTSTPVLAAIYARVLLGEPWLRLEQCAAVVASIGVALQFGGHQHRIDGSDHAAGLAFALAGAASAGGVYVLVRYLGTVVKVDWPILMLYQACGQMLLAFPAHVALRGGPIRTAFSQRSVLLLIACGAMGFLSQILMTRGMQRVKSASASIARLSGLPWSFLFQAVFTSDPVRGRTVAGALIVVASMGFVVHAARLKNTTPQAKVLVELPTYAKVRADDDDEYCGDSDD